MQNTRLLYSFADRTNWYISLDSPNDIYKRTTFDFNFPEKYFSAFEKSATIFQTNATMNTSIFIGSVTGAGSKSEAKVYSCQIYDGDAQVRNFIPCTNSQGVSGLYDLISKQFFQNSFSGAITPGPAV